MSNHTDVQNAAEHLAQAEAQVERAAEALAAAEAAYNRITPRVRDLEARRAALITRRQRGETHQDDAANLTLLDADLAGLEELRREAEAAIVTAKQPHDSKLKVLEAARWQLQRAEDEAAEAALIEHAGKLEGLLLDTMQQLEDLRGRLKRGRPAWVLSDEAFDKLRTIRAAAGRF